MNGYELFKLAPYGALVRFSDGKPRPPDRFNKKLSAWKCNNSEGYFVQKSAQDGFYLQTQNGEVLVVNQYFDTSSAKAFEVIPPKPGTILAYDMYLDKNISVHHVFASEADAHDWAKRRRYDIGKCGYEYLIVAESGERQAIKLEAKNV